LNRLPELSLENLKMPNFGNLNADPNKKIDTVKQNPFE
jgi:hypothetical protein